MYKKIPGIITPPDDTKIWRYLDLSKFLQFIHSKSLYFSSIRELHQQDKWEGVPSASFQASMLNVFKKVSPKERPQGSSPILEFWDLILKRSLVSCWHKNDAESIAMWKLYTSGTDGVAIWSTVGCLKSALQKFSDDVFIGEVHYSDHFKVEEIRNEWERGDYYAPVFQKRETYKHESEVRALKPFTRSGILSDFLKTKKLNYDKEGLAVPINLEVLIKGIIVSPTYKSWALNSLQRVLGRAGLSIEVALSDCLREPDFSESAADLSR